MMNAFAVAIHTSKDGKAGTIAVNYSQAGVLARTH
jgi:hypothetical protein